VSAIELDPLAAAEAMRGAPASHVAAGTVEEHIGSLLPADLVVLNPPRAGVDGAVCDALNASASGRLIYISCDPATLARDIRRLAAWEVRSVRCFDLFPQTSHVETVVELACAGS
jgi:23S rRNA (uracil1939-C5)-methyltransferase